MKYNQSIFSAAVIALAALFFLTPITSTAGDKNEYELHPTCGNALTKDRRDKLLRRIANNSNERPALASEKTLVSKRGLFLIHYATEGYNKPPMDDIDGNGTPDFVDSVAYYFEKAYELQVEQIGFRSPIPDDGSGGSTAFDVYLWDIGDGDGYDIPDRDNGGLYGLTAPYAYKTPVGLVEPAYTYIVIDNDFSPKDSIRPGINSKPYQAYKTFGIDGIKITATHEFQHAIQFTYGFKSLDPKLTVMEMCGVYMEYRQYPQIKDYVQYVNYIFHSMNSHPFGSEDPFAGYGHSIFMQFLAKYYQDDVFKQLWENVGKGMDVYSALDAALKSKGTSLDEKFTEFTQWIYYTGNRSVPGQYLDDSKLYNEMEPFQNQKLENDILNLSDQLQPYEIRLLHLTSFPADSALTEDTLDILILSRDLESAHALKSVARPYSFDFSKTQPGGMDQVDELSWFYKAANDGHIWFKFLPKPGTKSHQANFAYPNPYNPASDDGLFLPVPDNAGLYSNNNIQVVIYKPDMSPVYSSIIKVGIQNSQKTVRIPLPEDFRNGIYIYSVSDGNDTKYGKFAVKKHS